MIKKFPIILFFLAASSPTAEEEAEAMEFGPNVRFRNAEFGNHSGALEACDGVAGKVPDAYAKCPTGKEAIEKFMDENADRMAKAREGAQAAAQAREEAAQAAQAATATQAPAKGGKAAATPAPAPAQPAAAQWTANQ